jgi:hypothetical protein
MKPYIVLCGMPRSGTRQFADVLNQHPNICIQGESSRHSVPAIATFLGKLEKIYPSADRHQAEEQRYRALALAFAAAGKGRPRLAPKADIHGIKSPNHELVHCDLTRLIGAYASPVVYLYCIRNLRESYLSYLSMRFAKTVQMYIRTYLGSLAAAMAINEASEANPAKVRISVLHLDDFISTSDQGAWLSRRLFDPLGLKVTGPAATRLLAKTVNRNATAQAAGRVRLTQLPGFAASAIQTEQARLDAAIEDFNRMFGTSLALF